jgi:hypothetical protein
MRLLERLERNDTVSLETTALFIRLAHVDAGAAGAFKRRGAREGR